MAEPIEDKIVNSAILKGVLVEVVKKIHNEYNELNNTLIETKEKLDSLDTEVNERIAQEVTKIITDADEDFDTLKEISDWIKSDTTGAARMQSDILNNQNMISTLDVNKADKGTYEATKEFVRDANVTIDVLNQPEFSVSVEAPEIDVQQTQLMEVTSTVDDSGAELIFDQEVDENGKLTLNGRIDGLIINNEIVQPEFQASNANMDRVRDAEVISTSNKVNFNLYHNVSEEGKLTISSGFATPVITNEVVQPVFAVESIPQSISLTRTADVSLGITNHVVKEKPEIVLG